MYYKVCDNFKIYSFSVCTAISVCFRGVEVAKRRERNEWHHCVVSERERDRAVARPSPRFVRRPPQKEYTYTVGTVRF